MRMNRGSRPPRLIVLDASETRPLTRTGRRDVVTPLLRMCIGAVAAGSGFEPHSTQSRHGLVAPASDLTLMPE